MSAKVFRAQKTCVLKIWRGDGLRVVGDWAESGDFKQERYVVRSLLGTEKLYYSVTKYLLTVSVSGPLLILIEGFRGRLM